MFLTSSIIAELTDEMNGALAIPGVTNAWTMPIKNRLDMLSTGVRTPVGIKIFGSDLQEIERLVNAVFQQFGARDIAGVVASDRRRPARNHDPASLTHPHFQRGRLRCG